MAPRHTKSEFASNFLPAWMIGNKPDLKIIQATNNAELAVRFGRKAKSLMDMDDYKQIFHNSDCAILMTPWNEYKKINPNMIKQLHYKILIDTRRILKNNNKDGLISLGIGV